MLGIRILNLGPRALYLRRLKEMKNRERKNLHQ